MSQWTHLAGLIRLDSVGAQLVRAFPGSIPEKLKAAVVKALGNTCNFDSPREAWDQCTVPSGSEGSLQYSVFPNSEKDNHALSWGYVPIWGDLRDFGSEDVPKLAEWFEKSLARLSKPEGFGDPADMDVLEKANYMLSTFVVRDAVLSIDVEGELALILLWDDEAEKVIRLHA